MDAKRRRIVICIIQLVVTGSLQKKKLPSNILPDCTSCWQLYYRLGSAPNLLTVELVMAYTIMAQGPAFDIVMAYIVMAQGPAFDAVMAYTVMAQGPAF